MRKHGAGVAYGVLGASLRWPPVAALTALLVFTALFPDRYTLLPRAARTPIWVLVLLLLCISTAAHLNQALQRVELFATVAMLVLVTAFMLVGVGRIVENLFTHGASIQGVPLISTAVTLWTMNVVVFALWHWLLDRGGPEHRDGPRDLVFPGETTSPDPRGGPLRDWTPGFVDYLFFSFNTSVAFSPTDAFPLSARAKLLMMVQALVALVTLAIVAARAVNIVG
jgi:hypothetical protein